MNIWTNWKFRYEKEEIQKWTSLQKTAYLLLPLLVYLLVHDAVEILLMALLELAVNANSGVWQFFMKHAEVLQPILSGLAIIAAVMAIRKAFRWEIEEKEPGKVRVDVSKITTYAFFAGIAFLSAVGINILFYQLGITAQSENFQRVQEAQYGVHFLIGLILYGLISPFAEEAVFRGILYNRMKRCFGVRIALFTSALLFGCYHGNLVQALYGFILGVLIAYSYEFSEDFCVPVLFHSVANISVYVLTYHNSMNTLKKGTAITAAIIMLILAAGFFLYLHRKKEK